MRNPKTPEGCIEDSVDALAAIFEGYQLGINGKFQKTHSEIKDEFRLELRRIYASALEYGAEKMEKTKRISRDVVCLRCGEKQWEYTSHHSVNGYSKCCGKKNVDGGEKEVDEDTDRNWIVEEARSILLSEAQKVKEGEV